VKHYAVKQAIPKKWTFSFAHKFKVLVEGYSKNIGYGYFIPSSGVMLYHYGHLPHIVFKNTNIFEHLCIGEFIKYMTDEERAIFIKYDLPLIVEAGLNCHE